jgi:hypothetical protein
MDFVSLVPLREVSSNNLEEEEEALKTQIVPSK